MNLWFQKADALRWVITIAGMLAFLVLYFRAYHLEGRPRVLVIGGIALLGVLFAPINPGASTYFVYAAAFIGMAGETRFVLRAVAVLLVVIGVETLLFRLPPYFWIPAVVFSMMIAAVTTHYTQRQMDSRKLLMAQEEVARMAKVAERERIARDLHDVLGHTLSLIVLKSELASKLADSDPPRAMREIRDVERISRETLAQVRSTVRGYQAHSLQAEAAQATAALEAAGIEVHCDVPRADIPASHEGVLALVLREAVTNVIRHAKATTCRLSLHQSNGSCRLEIADNGCGKSSPEGVGLSGMRYRVEALGGDLERDLSSGTRLIVTLPVPSQ
jgi:two-component system sensor histidine kinase DesK